MNESKVREHLNEAMACLHQAWEHLNALDEECKCVVETEKTRRLKTLRGVLTDVQDNVFDAHKETLIDE